MSCLRYCSLTPPVKAIGCHLSSNSLYCYIILTYIVPLEVNVILRLTHLPPFPEYTMDLWRFPRGYGPLRPVSMEGLVISMTRVTKYTQGARFLCQNDYCPCSTGKNFATSLHQSAVTPTLVGKCELFLCRYLQRVNILCWCFFEGITIFESTHLEPQSQRLWETTSVAQCAAPH